MKKSLQILLITLSMISCKHENNYQNDTELCDLLGQMTTNDQKYRGMTELEDPFFDILDSLITAENITKQAYMTYSRDEQLEWGKKARKIADKTPKQSKKTIDSLMQLQETIDNENTKLLIDITKKRGWISNKDLGCQEYVSAFLIFRHSQKKYWKDIREIIELEKTEGRIGDGDYQLIDNHLKGRPEFIR
jgi:hypothetical protein